MRSPLPRRCSLSLVVVVAALAGCSEQIVESQKPLGGSCLGCHDGITDVHPFFALACVDCHGGNDQLTLPAEVNVRDQALLQQSHVLPLDASMWWPNGIDDDNDGQVDEQGEFFDGRAFTEAGSATAAPRLAPKAQMDAEMNRDVNYLRFLNPGDLRVASASCGSKNKNANAAMICHAEVVYDVRRSMMSTNSGVPMATYGNAQLAVARDYGAAFASSAAGVRFDARNPRVGRVGYTLDYDALDRAFDSTLVDDTRNLTSGGAFDRAVLSAAAGANIDEEDDKFDAVAGPVFDDGVTGDDAAFDAGKGLTRTGQRYQFFVDDGAGAQNNRAVEVLQNIGNRANNSGFGDDSGGRTWPDKQQHRGLQLRLARIVGEVDGDLKRDRNGDIKNLFDNQVITNPVDAALRNFRAYHSVNWWGPSDNFGFVDFFTSPNAADPPPADPSDVELRNKNNPFARGRPSGCSACHVEYAKNGHNEEPVDRTVADNGRQASTELPFGIRQDLGQHFYAKRHALTRSAKIDQCGACHGFVTRIDVSMLGSYEQETDFTNLEAVNTIGTFSYTQPSGKKVRIFDNLAHYKNGVLLNDGEGKSEDLNNNGELDTALVEADLNGDGVLQPNEDLNKNGVLDGADVVINEDTNGNAALDVPDRVRRSDAFDGRQNRIIYGGANGAVRLQDIHVERGFNCVDCHIGNDVHGDSNLYTRNWDAIQIECDDCHGTNDTAPSLVFSGPNGGDDMTSSRYDTPFGDPWFERKGDRIVQRSRVDPNLQWTVPVLNKPKDNASAYAHRQPLETFDPVLDHGDVVCAAHVDEDACTVANCSWDGSACRGVDRAYAHVAEPGQKGGLECYACHSSWQPNCLTCHLKMDVGQPKQEIWWGDDDVEDIFFQLFSYTRSPFYLGVSGNVEGSKIATHRSTMQVNLTVVATKKGAAGFGLQLAESAMFSTKGNLSSQASNPYFPHTVRTVETKQCVRCHTLVDARGDVANDHLITEATAQGTGRYQNVGDWAVVATGAGLDLLDLKKEAPINGVPNAANFITFPGFDFSDKNGVAAEKRRRVSFDLDSDVDGAVVNPAFDVALARGVSFENGTGDVTDVAIVGHGKGVSVVDVFGRDNNDFGVGGGKDAAKGLPPLELARIETLGPVRSVDIVDVGGSQSTTFIALSDEELAVFDYRTALNVDEATGKGEGGSLNLLDPDAGNDPDNDEDEFVDAGPDAAAQGTRLVGSIAHGLDRPTRVRLYGRFAFVTHAEGLAVFALGENDARVADIDLGAPLAQLVTFETRRPALDVVVTGRFAYVATGDGGIEVFDVGPVVYPLINGRQENGDLDLTPQAVRTTPIARALIDLQQPADSRGVAVWGSRLVVADGRNGVRILDVTTPADPRLEETIQNILGGGQINNASAVVLAEVPTRTFALVADGANLRAINITPVTDFRQQLQAAADDPDALRGFRLSMERQDPLTPFDPKNATRQIFTYPASGGVVAVARGLALDALADKGGRRLRDAWLIGAHPLEQRTIARMRSVVVTEVPNTKDARGDGAGCVVRKGDTAQQDPTTLRCVPDQVP